MAGKKDAGAAWHQTTVVLRSDIYRQALERGIDISDACNRALAALTGSGYPVRQPAEIPDQPPVIIAKNGASPDTAGEGRKDPSRKLHPVINADDPAAPARVVQAKSSIKKAPVEHATPGASPAPAAVKETPAVTPPTAVKKTAGQKERGPEPKKRPRGDALKKFFSLKIVRTDSAEAVVDKDELYELFARFCREQRIAPVPERKTITVALKNQFALTEKNVDGKAYWTGIQLK